MKIPCPSADIKTDFDAADATHYPEAAFDFVWLHPPHWRQIVHGDDPRCLSNAADAAVFYARIRRVIRNGASVLSPNGKIAVLLGDYFDVRLGKMVPCVHMTEEADIQFDTVDEAYAFVRQQMAEGKAPRLWRTESVAQD